MSRPKTPLTVPTEQAKVVFDIAVNSMDFGSGMLDHEEVGHLRAFARLINVDPMNDWCGGSSGPAHRGAQEVRAMRTCMEGWA